MIVDRIENFSRYQSLGPRIGRALDYLRTTDFTRMPPGEYAIEERDIYAIVIDHSLNPDTTAQLEAHRRYIDIQFLVRGAETMGYAPDKGQKAAGDYDAEGDCLPYAGPCSLVLIEQGMFAIFFPEDLHLPGIGAATERVRKVVVKVRV